MVGRETGGDLAEARGLGVIHEDLSGATLDREVLGKGVRGAGAELRLLVRVPDSPGEPHASVGVHGDAPRVGPPRPDRLVAVVRRRRRIGQDGRGVGRDLNGARPMLHGVEHGQDVARLNNAVDQPVGVDGRIADIRGCAVGPSIGFRTPVPERDHDIALSAGWTGRRLAGGQGRSCGRIPPTVKRRTNSPWKPRASCPQFVLC